MVVKRTHLLLPLAESTKAMVIVKINASHKWARFMARVVGGGQLASRRDLHVLPPLTVFDSN